MCEGDISDSHGCGMFESEICRAVFSRACVKKFFIRFVEQRVGSSGGGKHKRLHSKLCSTFFTVAFVFIAMVLFFLCSASERVVEVIRHVKFYMWCFHLFCWEARLRNDSVIQINRTLRIKAKYCFLLFLTGECKHKKRDKSITFNNGVNYI